MKKRLILTVLIAFVLLIFSVSFSFAQNEWYFPMIKYQERIRVKDFGQYIDGAFYRGRENLFPYNRFYGYHAAADLEVFENEKESLIPIYAVGDGKIVFVGSLTGYGGVILESLDGTNNTALYGHVKIANIPVKNGQNIKAGETVAYLGDEFSSETSRERKHLHFGIYKGKGQYFRGHEDTLENLNARWENPTNFLKERGAISTGQSEIKNPSPTPVQKKKNEEKPKDEFNIFDWINNLFLRIFRSFDT